MSEDLVLLAVTGDTCSGPAHLPARERRIVFDQKLVPKTRCSGRTQSLEAAVRLGNGFLPLSWVAACGEVPLGYLYLRTELTTHEGDCAECAKVGEELAAPPVSLERTDRDTSIHGVRYATENERVAARRASWRRATQRRRAA